MDRRAFGTREHPEVVGAGGDLEIRDPFVQGDSRQHGSDRIERYSHEDPVGVPHDDRVRRTRDAGQSAAGVDGLDSPGLVATDDAIAHFRSRTLLDHHRGSVAEGVEARASREDRFSSYRAVRVEPQEARGAVGVPRRSPQDPSPSVGTPDDCGRPFDGDPAREDEILVETVDGAPVAVSDPEGDRNGDRAPFEIRGPPHERHRDREERSRPEEAEPIPDRVLHTPSDRRPAGGLRGKPGIQANSRAPSSARSLRLWCRPPVKPPMWSRATMRWQGTKSGTGFFPFAPPTPRAALGRPIARATSA